MRPFRRAFWMSAIATGFLAGPVGANDKSVRVPVPIRAYASEFLPYCLALGKSKVVINEMYSADLFGAPDINHDGRPDYFAYKCMFGCDGLPFAFVGLGVPCAFGALLLSPAGTYSSIAVPGSINQFDPGPPLRIAVTRQRIHSGDCEKTFACGYIFELRQGRFQLVMPCPLDGCRMLVSQRF